MSLHIEWVVECETCKKTLREKARTLDLICDSDPVKVRRPDFDGWETDGLGGWLCKKCFAKWKKKGPADP